MRVVIVGGGFGGVRAALNLGGRPGFEVVLVSKQPYFEYHAALYRSATGRSPLEVAINLTDFFERFSNIEVIEDEIIKLDLDDKAVHGASAAVYRYDSLILAVGSVTQYFGITGLSEYSFGVKTIQEALELKRTLHEDLTARHDSERNYVVVGGGASGVELAAELVSYLRHVRRRHGVSTRFNIYLLEAAPSLLPSLPEGVSRRVEKRLKQLGVKVLLNTPVNGETANAIDLPQGKIKSHTVVWTAGTTVNPLLHHSKKALALNKVGRVVVNEYLEAKPGVYVVGDSAQTQYSGMAQTAIHDANLVTGNLKRLQAHKQPQSYRPRRPVYAVPVGPRWSAVSWGRVEIYGLVGWMLRRSADLLLYFRFLPLVDALTAWRYGFTPEEVCQTCRKR